MINGHTPRQIAAEMLDGDVEEDLLRAGTCLVAALVTGPVNHRIAKLTGIPLHDVATLYGFRLREARIWERRAVFYPWLDDVLDPDVEDGRAIIGFCLQTMVATGDMIYDRTRDVYRLATIMDGIKGSGFTEDEILAAPTRRECLKSRRLTRPHAGRKVLV